MNTDPTPSPVPEKTPTKEQTVSDRDLDAEVARVVFGYEVVGKTMCQHYESWDVMSPKEAERVRAKDRDGHHSLQPVYLASEHWRTIGPGEEDLACLGVHVAGLEVVPFYSSDPAAWWTLVQAMRAKGYTFWFHNTCTHVVAEWWKDGDEAAREHDPSLFVATCRAALAAVKESSHV